MQQANRNKLCKLQNKPGGEDVYILYETITSLFTNTSNIQDFAGIFDTKHDAEQVAECLTNIFSKLNDKHWKASSYSVSKIYFDEHARGTYDLGSDYESDDDDSIGRLYKYQVTGWFTSKIGRVLNPTTGRNQPKSYIKEYVRDVTVV